MSEVQFYTKDTYEYSRGLSAQRFLVKNHYFEIPVAVTRSAIRFAGVTVAKRHLASVHRDRKADFESLCSLLIVASDAGELKPNAPDNIRYIHAKAHKIFKALNVSSEYDHKMLFHLLVGWTETLAKSVKMDIEQQAKPELEVKGLNDLPPEIAQLLIKALASKILGKKGGDDSGPTKH